jgi:hypothetical protein
MARRSIENALRGQPEMTADPLILERSVELVNEARITLEAIEGLANGSVADALTDPITLTKAVESGILDAPHLRNNAFARGQMLTRTDSRGACIAIDPTTGKQLNEAERIQTLRE